MLKDFGFGRQGIEEHVKHEGDYMMDYLRANQADQDLDLMGILNVCVLNVLWRIVADKRYYNYYFSGFFQHLKIFLAIFCLCSARLGLNFAKLRRKSSQKH